MIRRRFDWIWLLLFLVVISYREVQILIDRGSWLAADHWIPLWYIDWQSMWNVFDSFHLMNGLAILFLFEFAVNYLPRKRIKFLAEWFDYQIWVVIYWFTFMQGRNLFMHHIF